MQAAQTTCMHFSFVTNFPKYLQQRMEAFVMWFFEELTRFERTRIISARALQVSMGAPVLIKTKHHDPKSIAREEFEAGLLPITVKRELPKKS